MPSRNCMRPGCRYPAMHTKRMCSWHWLLKQPMPRQIKTARGRAQVYADEGGAWRARVPKSQWPEGERWCADCQWFVPLFYCSGSICKAHASEKRHAKLLREKYGITPDDYERLLEKQLGVCYVCRRAPRNKRLAVDHDHELEGPASVRGLLCADNDRGCNHAVLGSLEGNSVDGALAAAKRLVEYLDYPPFQRLS